MSSDPNARVSTDKPGQSMKRIGGDRYSLSPEEELAAIRMVEVENKSQGYVASYFKVDCSTISQMMTEVRLKLRCSGKD